MESLIDELLADGDSADLLAGGDSVELPGCGDSVDLAGCGSDPLAALMPETPGLMLSPRAGQAAAVRAAAPPVGEDSPLPAIIGIRGDMGAGKDTLAAEICRQFPASRVMKFATKLRAAAAIIADIPAEQTESAEDKAVDLSTRLRPAPDLFARIQRAIELVTGAPADRCTAAQMFATLTGFVPARPDKMAVIPLTVGCLLQVLGTECFRALVSPNVWVKALFADWEAAGRPPAIIADTRFPNESAAIRARGGVVVLVRRRAAARADGRATGHPSERALDGEAADLVLDNDGSVPELLAAFCAALPALRAAAAART